LIRQLEPYGSEPIGKKWYVQSGEHRLVVHTRLGPIGAMHEFILRLLEHPSPRVEKFVWMSQAGFDESRAAHVAELRQVLIRHFGLLPEWLSQE
jgi:hypothetical protein